MVSLLLDGARSPRPLFASGRLESNSVAAVTVLLEVIPEREHGGVVVSRSVRGASILGVALFGWAGCSGYQYMRDVTPEIEETRKEYVVNNPKNDFNDDIAVGRVCKGMSRLQVRVTWGEPDRIAPEGGGLESWWYQEFEPSRGAAIYRLHFRGEILEKVDFQHGGTPISTDDPDERTPGQEPPVPRQDTGKKPSGLF
jgi:hypothetical protein